MVLQDTDSTWDLLLGYLPKIDLCSPPALAPHFLPYSDSFHFFCHLWLPSALCCQTRGFSTEPKLWLFFVIFVFRYIYLFYSTREKEQACTGWRGRRRRKGKLKQTPWWAICGAQSHDLRSWLEPTLRIRCFNRLSHPDALPQLFCYLSTIYLLDGLLGVFSVPL